MNNFAVKNVINNLEKNKDMPFQETNDVSLKANQIIYTSVNNNFQKMVNNDLYIQKQLLNKTNYAEGPRISSDEVERADDGYKVWNPSIKDTKKNEISILRKRVKTVPETVTKTECTETPYANFVTDDQNIGTVVGSKSGLYRIDAAYNNAQKIQVEGLGNAKCCATVNSNEILVGTDTGVWSLSDQISSIHKISEINDTNDLQNLSESLYAARNDGLYRLQYSSGSVSECSKIPDVDEKVLSLTGKDKKLIAVTDSKIYECEKEHTAFSNGKVQWIQGSGETVKDIVKTEDHVFFYTNKSIYRITDGLTAKKLLQLNGQEYVSSSRIIDGTLFFAVASENSETQTGIWKYDSEKDQLNRTGITISTFDIIKYQEKYFISTKKGIVYSDDLVKDNPVIDSTGNSQLFAQIKNDLFCSNGTSKLDHVVEKTKYELSKLLNEKTLSEYRGVDISYVCTTDGIYDGNLGKVYPKSGSVSIKSCKFIEIGKSKLSEVFACTDNGIIRLGDELSCVSNRTDIKDVKYMPDYAIVLLSDNTLYYTMDTSIDFWNISTTEIKELATNVSQVEDVGSDGYFLQDGSLNKCQSVTDLNLTTQYDISGEVLGLDDNGYLSSDNIVAYYDKNDTFAVSYVKEKFVYSKLKAFHSDDSIITRICRDYKDNTSSRGISPRIPIIRDGVWLRYNNSIAENIQIDDKGIRSDIIATNDVLTGTPLYTDRFSSAESFDQMIQYQDNSRGLYYQDDNITFFVSKNNGGYQLKCTHPQKINYEYVKSDADITDFIPMPVPGVGATEYLNRYVPQGIIYSDSKIYVLSSIEDDEGQVIGSNVKPICTVAGYNGHFCDNDWDVCEKTFIEEADTNENETYKLSCYTKCVYHVCQDSLYKTYYTVIIDNHHNPNEYKPKLYYLSSDISKMQEPVNTDNIEFAQNPVNVCTLPYNKSAGDVKIHRNGKDGYVYYTAGSKIYYQKNTISGVTNNWTKSNALSSLSYDYIEISEGKGFFATNGSDRLYIIDGIDTEIVKSKTKYSRLVSLGIKPSSIKASYLGGKSFLFAYGETGVRYIDINEGSIVNTITLPDFKSDAKIVRHYEFLVNDDSHICIVDSYDNIYEISYSNGNLNVEKKQQCVDSGSFTKCFQYEDPSGLFIKPRFDLTVKDNSIYINSFKLDYSSESLSNIITSSNKMVVSIISTTDGDALYLSNGKKLRRKNISSPDCFISQIGNFQNWDNYDNIWTSENYEFDSDINFVLTANVTVSQNTVTKLIVVTSNNNIYISDIDQSKKVADPVVWSQSFKREIERLGLTINKITTLNDNLVLCTNKGLYKAETSSVLESERVDTYKNDNVVKLVKLQSLNSGGNILAIKRYNKPGISVYDGDSSSEIDSLKDINVTNIHQGNHLYYVYGDTGVSTINNIAGDVKSLDDRLSGTVVSYTLEDNVYCVSEDVVGLKDIEYYGMDGTLDVSIIPSKLYQYNNQEFYIKPKTGKYIRVCDNTDENPVHEVKYNDKKVIDECQNFRFVQTADGTRYYDGVELYNTNFLSDCSLFNGGYLCRNNKEVHRFGVDNMFVPEVITSAINPKRVINVDGNIMVACSDGWYLYNSGNVHKLVSCEFPEGVTPPYAVINGDIDRFSGLLTRDHIFVLNGHDVYRSNTGSLQFEKLFTFDKDNITVIAGKNKYTYLFGTEKSALWHSSYEYEMIDDTKTDGSSQIVDDVAKTYELSIAQHITDYHEDHDGISSAIKYVNENLTYVDLHNVSETWNSIERTADKFVVVQNDIVDSVKFESSQTPICVSANNDFSNGEFIEIPDVTFIYKRWTSGQKELYIHIPSSNTFYKPHLSGLIYCREYDNDTIMANTGLSGQHCIQNGYTDIKVVIYRKYFDNVRNFSDIQIEGQSLPLSCYIDNVYDCGGSEKYFHSIIKQSVFSKKEHEPDTITLYFKCFGTDEQAVRLIGF